MNFPSLIFWVIFVLPFVVFMAWIIRQNKNKKAGITGLVILAVLVIVAVVYMYAKTGGK